MFGTILPMVRRVIMVCDENGTPYEDGDGARPAFETGAVIFAWLGFYAAFPFGEVMPLDARAMRGDVFATAHSEKGEG